MRTPSARSPLAVDRIEADNAPNDPYFGDLRKAAYLKRRAEYRLQGAASQGATPARRGGKA